MIRKLILIPAICLFMYNETKAQQDPVYSQYMFNMMGVNPAYAGSRDVLSLTGIYRRQWLKVDGAPSTQLFSADCAVRNKKVGIGLQVFNDEIGAIRNTGFYGSYAYRLRFQTGVLAFGIQAGLVKFQADYSSLMLSGSQDDNALAQNVNEYRANLGAGVFYSTDKFYLGFSAPHLTGQGKVFANNNEKIFEENNHWFLMTGVVLPLSVDLKLKPSLLVSMVTGAPIHIDINANLWVRDVVALGVSYRTGQSIIAMLELQLNQQLRFGYAYDWTLSSFGNKGGGHELMLRYEFGYAKKKIFSPRYF